MIIAHDHRLCLPVTGKCKIKIHTASECSFLRNGIFHNYLLRLLAYASDDHTTSGFIADKNEHKKSPGYAKYPRPSKSTYLSVHYVPAAAETVKKIK